MSTPTVKEWPAVVDEKIDDKFWQGLRMNLDLVIKTATKTEKMHILVNPTVLYNEKSTTKDGEEIGAVVTSDDLHNDPDQEVKDILKTHVPFVTAAVDGTFSIAEDCTLDFDYPDLQNLLFSLFDIEDEIKPGVTLVPLKKD